MLTTSRSGPKCGEKRCSRCGQSDHLIGQCKRADYQSCINCGGNHHHFNRRCSEFKEEGRVRQELNKWTSLAQQRQPITNWRGNRSGKSEPARSYAQIAKSNQQEAGERTSLTSNLLGELEKKMNRKVEQLEREIQTIKTQQQANQALTEAVQDNMKATTQELMEQLRMISQTLVNLTQGQQEMKEKIEQISKQPETKASATIIPESPKGPSSPTTPFRSPDKRAKKSIPRNKSSENLQTKWKQAQVNYEDCHTPSPRTPKGRTPPTRMEKSPAHKLGRRLVEEEKKIQAEHESDKHATNEIHNQCQINPQIEVQSNESQSSGLQQLKQRQPQKQQQNQKHQSNHQQQPRPQSPQHQQQNLLPQVIIDLESNEIVMENQIRDKPTSPTEQTSKTPRTGATTRAASKQSAVGKQQPELYQ